VSVTADPPSLEAAPAPEVISRTDAATPAVDASQHADEMLRATVETVITPHRGLFDWRLKQLWRYRDLVMLFVWRDFVAVYKQTILGPAWHVVRPLLATFVLTLVFSRFAGLSTDGTPAFLFYLAGYVLWTYFATALDNVSKTFIANVNLLGKVYFHRLVIPISLILSNAVSFGIQFALLMIAVVPFYMSAQQVHVTWWLVATPLLLLIVGGYALAGGLIVSAVTTRFRDLTYLITFGLQLFMYLTPVIYPLSAVSPRYRAWLQLNPLTPVIEAFRLGVLGAGTVQMADVVWSGVVMLAMLVVALMIFTKSERTFADTV
jgi:lipopolysaccharide transport system permease protein